jgi:zinc protease
MFASIAVIATILSATPAQAKATDASFDLALDEYAIDLVAYPFPSGLYVIFQEEHSQPVIAVTTVFDNGSEQDPIGMEGIAHVVEHLAFRAKHGDMPKNMDWIKQSGGSFNASTSVDWTNYMTIAPRDSMGELLFIEARRMKDGVANVTESDVRLEVEIARNEKRMRYENAGIGAAWDAVGSVMYPEGHAYRRSTIGSHASLSNIDLKAVQDFVKNNYVPEDTTMVVVGDFDLKKRSGMGILLDSWGKTGDLDLLMAPEDAEAYRAAGDANAKIDFVNAWMPKYQAWMDTQQKENKGYGAKKRVNCADRPAPPKPVSQEPIRVKGMVDTETVVVAWSAPGGYCGNTNTGVVAANLLTNYIYRTLVPSWEWSKDEQSIESLGCFYSPDEYYGAVMCFIEPTEGLSGERLAKKAADALYLQWDREVFKNEFYRAFSTWNFQNGKMGGMSSMLLTVDEVATLYGRATATAMDAHFTGDVRYFSQSMNEINQLDMFQVQEFARANITRQQMVTVIVEPLDEEERAKMEAQARSGAEGDTDYHATSRDDKLKTLFTLEEMTDEKIAAQVTTPDLTKIRAFTLDNGLQVHMMPYGEAPIVRAGLLIGGSGWNSPEDKPYLGTFANAMHYRGTGLDADENIMSVAGQYSAGGVGNSTLMQVSGASGNLGALLTKLRAETGQIDWVMEDKSEWIKDRINKAKGDGKKDPAVWADRIGQEHLYAGHRYGKWARPDDYEPVKEYSKDDVMGWVHGRFQPANAKLIIVGKIRDMAAAELAVRAHFGDWTPEDGVTVGAMGRPAAVEAQSDRMVFLFDKPTATQVDMSLSCQVKDWEASSYQNGPMLGKVISEGSWRRLRENAGVTYGAYAYVQNLNSGDAVLTIAGLFQNDATEFALKTMLDLVEESSAGDLDDSIIANAKWSTARTTVLGQQSTNQMMGFLTSALEYRGEEYIQSLPEIISKVSKADLVDAVAPCKGHETITIIGPTEYTEPAMKALGMPYEIVDWEDQYLGLLSEKEVKKHLKAKAKEEKRKAKEEAK